MKLLIAIQTFDYVSFADKNFFLKAVTAYSKCDLMLTKQCKWSSVLLFARLSYVKTTEVESRTRGQGQGHKRNCSQKRKGFQKKLLEDLYKKPFSKKIFKRSTNF